MKIKTGVKRNRRAISFNACFLVLKGPAVLKRYAGATSFDTGSTLVRESLGKHTLFPKKSRTNVEQKVTRFTQKITLIGFTTVAAQGHRFVNVKMLMETAAVIIG